MGRARADLPVPGVRVPADHLEAGPRRARERPGRQAGGRDAVRPQVDIQGIIARLAAGVLLLSARHGRVAPVKIYVAGPLADVATVRAVQSTVLAAGHELTLDWTEDVSLVEDYGSQLDVSGKLAEEELNAVIAADAVLVVASEQDGRRKFVELGAALALAQQGELAHVVLVGEILHESVSTSTRWFNVLSASRNWLGHLR